MGRFVTNRGDVEGVIRQGGWLVAFSERELTESDALGALVAAGVAIYTDQPEVLIGYLDDIVDESIDGMEAAVSQTFQAEVVNQIKAFALPAISNMLNSRSAGEQHETLGNFGIKAGLAQFIGHNEEWNPLANPSNLTNAGAWQQYGPGLVSYCPYVGIRYLLAPPTTPYQTEYVIVRFQNQTSEALTIQMRWTGSHPWATTTLPAGQSYYWYTATSPKFWQQFAASGPQCTIDTSFSAAPRVSIVKTAGVPDWNTKSSVTGTVEINLVQANPPWGLHLANATG